MSGPRQLPAHEIICICGQRGMGKSHKAKEITIPLVRCCTWDPLREYGATMGGPAITVPEFEQRERAGLLYKGVLRAAVRPTIYAGDELQDEFDRFCAVCLRVGAMTVVVDEVSLVASPMDVSDSFGQLLAIGRHRACSAIIVGQRFAQFPRLATAQASRIIAFRQVEPADLKDLGHRIGDTFRFAPEEGGADELKTTQELARTLPRYTFIDWTPESGVRIHGPR